MKYELKTYQGLTITMSEGFDLQGYFALLNNKDVDSVAIGSVSTLKNNIQNIRPVYGEGGTPTGDEVLIYSTRGGNPYSAHVENYVAGDITTQVNDHSSFILVGDTVINRNEYSLVMLAS